MTQYTYLVQYDFTGVNTDITDFCQRVEWNEVGTGEVRNSTIRLNAQDGAFITNPDFTGTDKTPLISQFDQITLTVFDRKNNARVYNFEVDILRPIENTQTGTILEVELLALENQLMRVNFSKPFLERGGASSGFEVTRDIVDFYNDPNSKGPTQPIVEGHDNDTANGGNNDLPPWTANAYHFELSEQSNYDALLVVADRMGSSIPAGGAGDFFEIYFRTNSGDVNKLDFHGFISGNPPDQQSNGNFDPSKAELITDTTSVNPGEEEGGIEAIKGNVVGTWGADGTGTLPQQNARFNGSLELWQVISVYRTGITYLPDVIVQTQETDPIEPRFNQHYKCLNKTTENPTGGGSADWETMDFVTFLFQNDASGLYSFWTVNNATEWRSCGANLQGALKDGATFSSVALWDMNQVVIDGTFNRTWVDFVVHDPAATPGAIPNQYLYPGNIFYRGFRVLIDGQGSDQFTGFNNVVIQCVTPGNFDDAVFVEFGQTTTSKLVADDSNGVMYQFFNSVWNEITTPPNDVEKADDCYHIYYDVFNSQGFVNTKNGGGGSGASFTAVVNIFGQVESITVDNGGSSFASAEFLELTIVGTGNNALASVTTVTGGVIQDDITIDAGGGFYNQSNPPDVTVNDRSGNYGGFSGVTNEFRFAQNDIARALFKDARYYRTGAWINFRLPFPPNSYNNNTLGEFYGTDNSKHEPVTLDSSNMHLAPNGAIGFNHGQADNLGPLDSLSFATKFNWRYQQNGFGSQVRQGNFACRCHMVDTSDNVVVQDFNIPFNNEWAQINLPLSEFKIYRGRKPITWSNIGSNIFLQELEVLQVFEYHNIQKIGLEWLGAYDDEGRWNPVDMADKVLFPSIEDKFYAVLQANVVFQALTKIDGFNLKWTVDAFEFSKAGLVLSDPVTSTTAENLGKAIQPRFYEEPLISNIVQLGQSNDAKKEFAEFQQIRYDVVTEGLLETDFGDSFFLKNSDLVPFSELAVTSLPVWATSTSYPKGTLIQNNTTGFEAIESHVSSVSNEPPNTSFWEAISGGVVPNTIKLVAKNVNYVIDKPPAGVGGFLRTIKGAKRIEAQG